MCAQEFCNGGSLRHALLRGYFDFSTSAARWEALMQVLGAVASGMDYMHSKRICHGDLNPSNVLFKARAPVISWPARLG